MRNTVLDAISDLSDTQVIDGTDLYWARSRVFEYLNFAAKRLPKGLTLSLGPDATGVGWTYQYIVCSAQMTLAELRSLQDWTIRYQLAKAEGVAEVAVPFPNLRSRRPYLHPRQSVR